MLTKNTMDLNGILAQPYVQPAGVPPNPVANKIAQGNVIECACTQGVPLNSPAVADQGKMLERFWLNGKTGFNTLDRGIAERAGNDKIAGDMKKLADCLQPKADQVSPIIGGLYARGVETYQMARQFAIRGQDNPAVMNRFSQMMGW